MKNNRSTYPILYRAVNFAGKYLQAANLAFLRLDEETVTAAARKETGLTDFGDPHYRQGLLTFLESANNEANLHPIGRFSAYNYVSSRLAQRLHLVEVRKRDAQIFEKPLLPPIIITGLARSGTTFLHNLLALDSNHCALPMWMLTYPFPDWPGTGRRKDPRITKAKQNLSFRMPLFPHIDSIHYVRWDSYEECIHVLGLTLNSLIFNTLFPVFSYMDWYLQNADSSQKYREYRWILQVFQSRAPGRHLTMKAPAHTGNLETLLQHVPNAMIIQTHRDPVACLGSVLSLTSAFYHAVTFDIDANRFTNGTLKLYEHWFRKNLKFRESHPEVIHDVDYASFVSDPIETVRSIYAHFDLPISAAYEEKLKGYIRQNPKNKHGRHSYNLSDYGLTEGQVSERLGFYSEYLGL